MVVSSPTSGSTPAGLDFQKRLHHVKRFLSDALFCRGRGRQRFHGTPGHVTGHCLVEGEPE